MLFREDVLEEFLLELVLEEALEQRLLELALEEALALGQLSTTES